MTEAVSAALGIDKVDIIGKLLVIDERHGSDANFLINTVISSSLEKEHGICLVLFHNTFRHYHNVGMKLGYNLNVLRERGYVTVIEPMKIIDNNIEDLGNDSVDASSVNLNASKKTTNSKFGYPDCMKLNADVVRQLFAPIKNQCYEVLKNRSSIVIIIDDLSHLLDMQLSSRDVWFFVRYLKSLMEFEPNVLSICIMTHSYRVDPELSQPDSIATRLKYMAQLLVTVDPLMNGHANDVSGKMVVNWSPEPIKDRFNSNMQRREYLYKLSDRQIKVFAPGAAEV